MRLCSIRGADVCVTVGAVLAAFVLCLLLPVRTLFVSLLSLFAHESAHCITANRLGVPVRRITVYPLGAVLSLEPAAGTRNEPLWIALSAPLCNLIVCGASAAVLHLVPVHADLARLCMATNLCLGVGNLLPIWPLDGGRVLHALLERAHSPCFAKAVSYAVSSVLCLGILICGAYAVHRRMVPSDCLPFLLCLPVLFVSAAVHSRTSGAETILRHRSALQRNGVVPVRTVAAAETVRLKSVLSQMSGAAYNRVLVLNRMGEPIGTVGEAELLNGVASAGPYGMLGDLPKFRK